MAEANSLPVLFLSDSSVLGPGMVVSARADYVPRRVSVDAARATGPVSSFLKIAPRPGYRYASPATVCSRRRAGRAGSRSQR